MSTRATYGGAGWHPRELPHTQEIGSLWQACGVDSEISPLRQVLLAQPGEALAFDEEPDAWLMLRRPDLARIQAQCRDLVATYEGLGVQVHLARPTQQRLPNHIFQRDLFFMTPEGVVLARPAAQQRAGEEREAAEALAGLGVPILMSFRGHETFEGADALWLDARTVLVGVGLRTNEAAFHRLSRQLKELDVTAIRVPMPSGGIQHLLGVMNFIDRDLVALRHKHVPEALSLLLQQRGLKTIDLPEHPEILERGAMNFVSLGPRRLLMPANCPTTLARYQAADIEVHQVDVSEYLAAAGGLGCLTGIVAREPSATVPDGTLG